MNGNGDSVHAKKARKGDKSKRKKEKHVLDFSHDLSAYLDQSKPYLHQLFPSVRQPTMPEVQEKAKLYGLDVNFGKFSSEEDEIIKKNFCDFCEIASIEDNSYNRLILLGFVKCVNMDERHIKKLAKEYGFKYVLGNNLPNRLIGSIYQRARKVCAPLRSVKDIDSAEYRDLIKCTLSVDKPRVVQFAVEQGISPKVIGALRRRPPCEKTVDCKWSEKETAKLIKRLCRKKKVSDASNIYPHSVKWESIARKVPNHSANECLTRFLVLLRHKDAFYRRFFKGDTLPNSEKPVENDQNNQKKPKRKPRRKKKFINKDIN